MEEADDEWEQMFAEQEAIADELGMAAQGRRLFDSLSLKNTQTFDINDLENVKSANENSAISTRTLDTTHPAKTRKNIWECSSLAQTSPTSKLEYSAGLDDDSPVHDEYDFTDYAQQVSSPITGKSSKPPSIELAEEFEVDFTSQPRSALKRPLPPDSHSSSHNNPFARLKMRITENPESSVAYEVPTIAASVDEVVEDHDDSLEFPLERPVPQIRAVSHVNSTLFSISRSNPTDQSEIMPKSKYLQIPTNSGFKSAKTFAGERLYFSYNNLKRIQDTFAKKKTRIEDTLLERSVYRLMEDLKAEAHSSNAEKIQETFALNVLKDSGNESTEDEALLVDKYRPKSYVDLLTDEWLNQEILLWVKQWDGCVFQRTPSESMSKKFRFKSDQLGRPEKKIILLNGPPGFGKTTLAHVIARQCGYQVFEINASDERSADYVNNRLMNAIESQSVFGDKKPNLVIIDEIDGALNSANETGFIKTLVNLASSNSVFNKKPGSKKGNRKSLMRPIICICNDLYAPALRPLRAVSQIYTFRRPNVSVISKRLKSICDREEIRIEKRALSYLVEKADCDMRTCLNTLQILKGKLHHQARIDSILKESTPYKKKPSITLSMIKETAIGDKDMRKSVFSVWESIFMDSSDGTSEALALIESNGDYELIMNGCFESYLNMSFRDSDNTGSSIVDLHEYVWFYDYTMQKCYDGHDISFNYFSHSLLAFRAFCRHLGLWNRQAKLIQFPRSGIEFNAKLRLNRQLALDVINYVDPLTKSWLGTPEMFCSQLVSFIIKIISPVIRPVNPQLLKQHERETLSRLVQVMTSLRLTYRQEKSEKNNGIYIYKLEPAIENLICFENNQLDRQLLSGNYSVRQLIAQFIEQEHIRREQKNVSRPSEEKQKAESKKIPKTIKNIDIKVTKTVPKDFFGRPIIQTAEEIAAAHSYESTRPKIQFKFHEGFSNAVRRTVLISDFLQKGKTK